MRSASFAATFLAVGLHLRDDPPGTVLWALLALQFLLYPHLMYWRARRAENPRTAETNNLVVDSVLLGAWMAVLAFPLWITFALFISTALNKAVTRGAAGISIGCVAFAAGALAGVVLAGFRFSPATDWPATLVTIVGLTLYLFAIGILAHTRNNKLRETREMLRAGEEELLAVNESLHQRVGEIHRLQERLQDQANRDPLTGLYNRRYLDPTLERELARCRREGLPLSLIMMDIDHFKRINDEHGHPAGDAVLKRLAGILLEQSRAEDLVCRHGGEEFLAVQAGMPSEVAQQRAEEWRRTFAESVVEFEGARIRATLSIGIVAYPEYGRRAEDLIAQADQALYAAKSNGRNCLVVGDRVA